MRTYTHIPLLHLPPPPHPGQDELVATEMVFSGLLTELGPAEAVALLSALVFQEKSDVEPTLPPKLQQARADLAQLVAACATAQQEHGLQVGRPRGGKGRGGAGVTLLPCCPALASPCCPALASPCCPALASPSCPALASPCCPALASPCCPALASPCCPALA